jgi:hypothetical protein
MKLLFVLLSAIFVCLPVTEAMVSSKELTGINYDIVYPLVDTDSVSENMINSDIMEYIKKFKMAFDAAKFESGKMNYKVKFEDDGIVSLVLTDYRYSGGAHGLYWNYGIVYNKKTGVKLPLNYFVHLTSNDLQELYYIALYREQGTRIYPKEYQKIKRVPEDYFLLGDGSVNIIFMPYELSCFADGAAYIHIDANKIEYFNRKNK